MLGLALIVLAGACSPLVHPAVQQQRMQEAAMKQQQQTAPVQQTAKPAAAEGQTHQP